MDQTEMLKRYDAFLDAKICMEKDQGFKCELDEINPICKPHQAVGIKWMVEGGRRALFEAFGLGKTIQQLEAVRLTLKKLGGGVGLIVAPLGVRQEFLRDAAMLGTPLTFVRRTEEVLLDGIYLTNYESVRDGKLDARKAQVVSLDEAAVLRGFGGTLTFRKLMALFEGSSTHRFVATATPSPNEYIELLAYAAFLGVMQVSEAKTRFFKRDSTKADKLTLLPAKAEEFWLWVASWALFLQKPSDFGPEFSDEGYTFPPLEVNWHEVPCDHTQAVPEKNGQGRLLNDTAYGVSTAAKEKRRSLDARIAKMMEIRAKEPDEHRIIWHDLEDERRAIEAAIPGIATVYGSQDIDDKEKIVIDFAEGKIPEIAGKPSMLGAGVNFQRHCHKATFLGIGFKFYEFVQGVHRIQRFLQTKACQIDIIYSEAERAIKSQLERKWKQHDTQVAAMSKIIRQYGLATAALKAALQRAKGVQREEAKGKDWTLVHNDSILECAKMPDNFVHLIWTSIPFSQMYEYSPNYSDMGHTDDMDHFFMQMDFLTDNLYRILQPGRLMIIHVKDRIVPGGMTNLGFQTVDPFHAKCIEHYTMCPECRLQKFEELRKNGPRKDRKLFRCQHRFGYMGMKTIVTDVVRENGQTYRLGWTEQCKDGTKMGVGMPEYLLIFRKPPTDSSNGYADTPVVKDKKWHGTNHSELCSVDTGECNCGAQPSWFNPEGYSRGRWQFDAAGFTRDGGNRLLCGEDFRGLSYPDVFKLFKRHSNLHVHNHEQDVEIADALDARGMLPPTFQLLQTQSWHPDVWTDVTRMRTLNAMQQQKGFEQHICPSQFDTVDRCIKQFTMPGELVFDPFSGLGTTTLEAVKLGRKGYGVELCGSYWQDSVWHLKRAEATAASPSLFDLQGANDEEELPEVEPEAEAAEMF